MNRFITATLLTLGFGVASVRATDSLYQNYGIVTNAPSINASNFYNQGTFTNFNTSLPYDTQNTINFTNRGTMSSKCGFRFDTAFPTGRKAASTFYNHGLISGEDSGSLFFGVSVGGSFFTTGSAIASYVLVSATNIINDGTLQVGDVGLMRLTGKNINLTRGAVIAGELNNDNTNTFNTGTGGVIDFTDLNSGRGFLLGNAYVNPSGVVDLYWGATAAGTLPLFDLTGVNGTIPEPFTPSEPVQYPGGFGSSVSLPVTFPAEFQAYFLHNQFEPQPELSYSVDTNHYVNIVFVRTNLADTNITINVRFSDSFFINTTTVNNFNPNGVEDIVQFGVPTEDVITGTTVTNAFYLIDSGAFYKVIDLATNAESPNSIARPINFEITTATPFEWIFANNGFDFFGTNTAPYDPRYIYDPGNSKLDKVPYTSGSYGAQVGRNPENGDGLTSSTNNALLFNAFQVLADPTNQAGRIEINADNLDMTQARIRAEGLLSLNVKHLQGGGSFGVDAGIVNGDIASTNGFLTLSNVMPAHFKRVRGDVYAWSANFVNTETNVMEYDFFGPTGNFVTNVVNYHILVVDSALKADFTPTVRHLALRATNSVVVKDSMKIVRTSLFDTPNLTLQNVVTLAEAGGALHVGNIPKLKNILIETNGALAAENDVMLGYDTAKGLNTITNRGLLTGSAVLTKSVIFENSGIVSTPSGGSISLQASNINLLPLAGTVPSTNSTLGADRDITLIAGSLTLGGTFLTAGSNGAGQLTLTVTNLLTDNVPNTTGTNNVITNFIHVTDGFIVNRQPASGSLYGTEIKTVTTNFNQTLHVWAGTDLGPTAAGYAGNVVIGRLVLDRQGAHSSFHFTGVGEHSAMYVDFLELDDLSFTDYRNGLIIDPNLTIYFAGSTADPEKLETVYPGRLIWVRDVAGPNSTVSVPRADGSFCLMNRALATSTDLDSDQDGTANAYDTYPLDNLGDPSLSVPCPGDVSSSSVTLTARSGNVANTLNLVTTGPGKVTPNMGLQKLALGKSYTLTAVPNAGAIFTGWSGWTNSTKPVLNFVMKTNSVLHATFIPNPFIPLKGVYNGLFSVDGNVQQAGSGFVYLTVTDKGAFSGHLTIGGVATAVSGQFDLNGVADIQVKRTAGNLTVHLQLDVDSNSLQIHGTVASGIWTATLLADLAVAHTAKQPSAQAGVYTVSLPGSTNGAANPAGHGYATITVSALGTATISGKLADGSLFSQSVPVSTGGHIPLFVSLLAGKESALGWLAISDDYSEVTGTVTWINQAAKRAYYPAGYTNVISVIGSRYTAPAAKTTGLTLLNPAVYLTGGNLAAPLTKVVTVDATHLTCASADRSVVLTLNTKAGTFTGSVVSPVTKKAAAAYGILLQKQNQAGGYFLGTNQSGGLLLQSQ